MPSYIDHKKVAAIEISELVPADVTPQTHPQVHSALAELKERMTTDAASCWRWLSFFAKEDAIPLGRELYKMLEIITKQAMPEDSIFQYLIDNATDPQLKAAAELLKQIYDHGGAKLAQQIFVAILEKCGFKDEPIPHAALPTAVL